MWVVYNSHTCNSTILDTGATNHFYSVPTSSAPHDNLRNIQPDPTGIQVLLPNHETITSTHKAKLNTPTLPDSATSVHLFPSLASGSLLSVGQLCDADCIATFTKSSANISHHGTTILKGSRHPITNLWHLDPITPLATSPTPSANTVLGQPNAAARMKFFHAALFSPPLSTL